MKTLRYALALGLATMAPAQATTIVDTGIPDGSQTLLFGYWSGISITTYGTGFTLNARTTLTALRLYVADTFNSAASVSFTIFPDQGNALGQLLFTQTDTQFFGGGWDGLNGLSITLDAGNYVLAATNPTSFFYATGNAPHPTGRSLFIDEEYSSFVLGNSPSPLGWQIDGDLAGICNTRTCVPGTVPEPQNWALLIAGFGLTGVMARRRRRLTR